MTADPSAERKTLVWATLGTIGAIAAYAYLRRIRAEASRRDAGWRPPRLERRRLGGGSSDPVPRPYPAIERHAVIGDRRTAALVAADGTLDWLCLPDYDDAPAFGHLLDAGKGGFWRLGPARAALGHQRYRDDSAVLVTTWRDGAGMLELTDAMLWPQTERRPGDSARRVVLRRLRCTEGAAQAHLAVRPRDDFRKDAGVVPVEGGMRLTLGGRTLGLWASVALEIDAQGATARLHLEEGEEVWTVLGLDEDPAAWSVERARAALDETDAYWRLWLDRLTYTGPRKAQVLRSALTFHLLTYAPTGALVAAPTTSLPERLGGPKNYDYRFTWIRDISLALATTAALGDVATSERYMDWLAGLDSGSEMPLQVLYRIDSGTDAEETERADLAGYRGSTPVRTGNHAFRQKQIDSLGFLAHCAQIYLHQGGRWKPEYWDLVRRIADYTTEHWPDPGHGIWELDVSRHFVTSKVMAWVTLDRAIKVGEDLREPVPETWRAARQAIHAEVMERGWSERLQAFRQHYEADSLDASVLLMPLMGFLPGDHPRMRATIDRIAERLTIDGFVYRFDPQATPGQPDGAPLGESEGAFLACTLWLAGAYALAGEPDTTEAILDRVEAIAGDTGLLAEEVDPRTGTFLGNTPLLLSHAAYMMAARHLGLSRPLARVRLMAGQATVYVRQHVSRLHP